MYVHSTLVCYYQLINFHVCLVCYIPITELRFHLLVSQLLNGPAAHGMAVRCYLHNEYDQTTRTFDLFWC